MALSRQYSKRAHQVKKRYILSKIRALKKKLAFLASSPLMYEAQIDIDSAVLLLLVPAQPVLFGSPLFKEDIR